MNIGVFINYAPDIKLETEGLGRYLGSLVKGFVQGDNHVTIACPLWGKKNVQALLKDLDIKDDKISFLTTSSIPPIWHIYTLLTEKKSRKPRSFDYRKFIDGQIIKLSTYNFWGAFLLHAILVAIMWLFFLLVFSVKRLIKKAVNIIKRAAKKVVFRLIKNKSSNIATRLHRRMMEQSEGTLVNMINHYPKQDVWYVPSLFWPQIGKIKDQTVVVNVPDLVTNNFAGGFANIMDGEQTSVCRRTLSETKVFITYCDYVGRELVGNNYFDDDKKWFTIRHANHDLLPSIEIPGDVQSQMNVDKDLTHEFAISVLKTIRTTSDITLGTHLSNAHYIFYASQFRPNKNLMNLIKAYEILCRRKFRHERLVLTGRINENKELRKYIKSLNLENEIVFCSGVTNQQLAALYHCADLVVNPTLYEGGFPFTFGEGMSVGTPSIMSDIPQTREIFEPANLEDAMFDPTDPMEIADKIVWALNNLNELYEKELPLYSELAKRTDKEVAEEYLKVFNMIKSEAV